MPNGNELSNELKFEEQISNFTIEGKFLARQLYSTCEKLEEQGSRIKALEGTNKKMFGVSGGVGGVIAGAIIGLVNYFTGSQR